MHILIKEGDFHDFGNHNEIKVMSHTINIWERITERRVRKETIIAQFGFMLARWTTDTVPRYSR